MWDVAGRVFTESGLVLEACGGSWVPMSTNRGIAPSFWVSWVVFFGYGGIWWVIFFRNVLVGSGSDLRVEIDDVGIVDVV